ncbi:DUF6461 domain-containing protein [Streptomyces sp. NPDC095613]|uniref:DUF6461 domain-containing protein n=1 Tax=Streptomyces sp. NPDC095613 TaxID=3155540 RepID=UPI00333166FE
MSSDAWNWVTNSQFPSFSLVFARSKSPESMLEAYGADVEAATRMTRKESISAFPKRKVESLFRVGILGDWAFCYEDRQLLGLTNSVRECLSQGCETIGLHKGADGTRVFERMENSRSVEMFEPDRPSEVRGDGPFILSDLVREKLTHTGPERRGISALLLVLTEHFGLELDWETLEGPLLTAPLSTR